ncbi:MAG: hypothetical protein ACKVWR_12175 [Acidimicrobiales bacterium]
MSAVRASGPKGFAATGQELRDLVVAYAKQETIEPLKGLARYVAWGVAGASAMALAAVLVLLGVLRLLQTETGDAFDGNWSFVPYAITLLGAVALIGVLAAAISRAGRRGRQPDPAHEAGGSAR